MAVEFIANLKLKDSMHLLNQTMDKVEYRSGRYYFESPWMTGSIMMGKLGIGIEYRLWDCNVKQPLQIKKLQDESMMNYMDFIINENQIHSYFSSSHAEGGFEVGVGSMISCNFQLETSRMDNYLAGLDVELDQAAKMQFHAAEGTHQSINDCMSWPMHSLLDTKIVTNVLEGIFLKNLRVVVNSLSLS